MTEERFVPAAQRWMDTVFRLAYSYTKNREDADDVTQEVLLALWREEKEFASEEHLRNWLIRVTLNRCKALFRRLRRDPGLRAAGPHGAVSGRDGPGAEVPAAPAAALL